MPTVTLSSEEKTVILARYIAGDSVKKLTKMFSLTRASVKQIIVDAQIPLRNISMQRSMRLKYNQDQVFPSGSIVYWSQPRQHGRVLVSCGVCNIKRYIQSPRAKKFTGLCLPCSNLDLSIRHLGPEHHYWKGGRTLSEGYIYIHQSLLTSDDLSLVSHTLTQGGYILEHRLVMARHLGRALERHEIVHHLNGIKDDNRITNLLILTASTHGKVEAKLLAKTREEIKRLQVLLEAQGIAY